VSGRKLKPEETFYLSNTDLRPESEEKMQDLRKGLIFSLI
jgi:hypothetical protein